MIDETRVIQPGSTIGMVGGGQLEECSPLRLQPWVFE